MSEADFILELQQLPIQQNRVYFSRAEAIGCPKGDIVLVQDPETGIVHNNAFNPALMTYDEHYQNEQDEEVLPLRRPLGQRASANASAPPWLSTISPLM